MKEEIIQIFNNQVVPEAETGIIKIDGWNFNIRFSINQNSAKTMIASTSFIERDSEKDFIQENKDIVITVKNPDRFYELLVEYTEKMYEFIVSNPGFYSIDNLYFEGKKDCIIKGILSTVWINATEENFKNPESFLETRISFLEDKTTLEYLGKEMIGEKIELLDNSYISSSICKQNPVAHETPYVFTSKIQKEIDGRIETFELPNISYGIKDDTCYVYSIQNSKSNQLSRTPYQKKINRLLYQAEKNVHEEYKEESIKDISEPHLFALTIFFKFIGIKEVIIPDYLPIRYNAKIRVLNNKIRKLEKTTNKEELENIIASLEQEIDKIQDNITQKYLRTFRRLEYHFPKLSVTSYPYEVDNYMHMKTKMLDDPENNHILYEVYKSIAFDKNRRK